MSKNLPRPQTDKSIAPKSNKSAGPLRWVANAIGEAFVGYWGLKVGGVLVGILISILQAIFAIDSGIPYWIAIMYAALTFFVVVAIAFLISWGLSKRKLQAANDASPSQSFSQSGIANAANNEFRPHNEFKPTIQVFPQAGQRQPQPQQREMEKRQHSVLPTLEYKGYRVINLPLNMAFNTLGDEHVNEKYLREEESLVRAILARFYYKPEIGVSPWISVKPHIFFQGKKDIYDATWYREEDEYKEFRTGKAYELIIGLLPVNRSDVLVTYEYDRKPLENTFGQRDFFIPNSDAVEGSDFHVRVELLCKRHGELLATRPFYFTLTLDPEPRLEEIKSDLQSALSGEPSKAKTNRARARRELIPLLEEGRKLELEIHYPPSGDFRADHGKLRSLSSKCSTWGGQVDRTLTLYLDESYITRFHAQDEQAGSYWTKELHGRVIELEKIVNELPD